MVDDALVQNKTEIEIKSLLTGMCHALESGPLASLAPFCYEVAQDTTQIVKLIAMEATPDRVCDILFASCANNAPQTFHTTPIDLNADKCDECKTIVGTVEGILAQNSTEQEIEVIMDKLCKLLGNSSFAPICEGIAGNIPAIIQMLENKYTPDEVCAMVGMCNSTSTRVNVAIDKCDVCEEIVGLAEGALAQNKTEEEIETLLNEMCSAISNSPLKEFASACHSIADNVPLLVQLLEQELPASRVCELLKVCTGRSNVAFDAGLDKCDVCEEIVTLAEDALASNKTEEEIEEKMKDLCKTIGSSPLKEFEAMCEEIAGNIPLLVQLLESKLPPSEVCTLLKMCSSHITFVSEAIDECEICQEAVTLVEDALSQNKTEQEIQEGLEKLCSVMADSPLKNLAGYCNEIASKTALVIQLLEDELPPKKVCSLLKLCTSEDAALDVVEGLGLDKCDLCKEAASLAEAALERNATEQEIEDLMDKLCTTIDNSPLKSLGPVCHEIAGNVPQLIQLLESNLPPEKVCEELGICGSTEDAVEHATEHMLTDLHIDKCSICEEVVQLAEGALQRNSTEEEIEGLVNNLCTVIENSPLKEFAPVCHEIASNIPTVIQLLEAQLPPDRVCSLLKLCSSDQITSPAPQRRPVMPKGDGKCEMCEQIVTLAENALQQNSTEEEIATLLNSACTALENSPLKSLAATCHQVASNIPLLVQLLESELPPAKVCTLLKICSSAIEVDEARNVGDKCAICEQVASLAESALEKNSTEQEIESLLDNFCNILENSPLKQFAPACKEVASNVPLLVQLLEQELPADRLCTLLKMCGSGHVVYVEEMGVDNCDMCQEVIQLVEFELEQNKTETELVTLAKELCTAIGKTPLAPLEAACNTLANDIPNLIVHLEQQETPKDICTKLGQCSSGRRSAYIH